MSSTSNFTPTASTVIVNWACIKTPELESDIEDDDVVVADKAKECRRCKVEKKRREDEARQVWEEEEKCCQEEEEERHKWEEEERHRQEEVAEARRREAEQREHEESERLVAEANKKRQREGVEARPSTAHASGFWLALPARLLPTAIKGEKKKRARKAKTQDDDEVEIVGESRPRAGPSRPSLDRLVMAIEEMSDWLAEMAQAQRESTEASLRATKALEFLVDEG
ncbi:hypothetical protein BU15DRAFT_64894 [Melanogaster broomeanus]|nr:hypothetical protein BU15DRAFT_64894 [Melanogaster broomeanus]